MAKSLLLTSGESALILWVASFAIDPQNQACRTISFLLQATPEEAKIAEEVRVLNNPDKPNLAVQASMRLENRGRTAIPAILAFVKEKGRNALTLMGAELLTRIKDERIAALCAELLADKDFYWRPMAMQALAAQESKAHVAVYRGGLRDALWGVRANAVAGLEAVADRDSRADVAKLLDDAIYDVRAQAAKTLFAWGDESGLPVLVESLRSEVRWFDIDYGQLAREDSWNFLVKIAIKEKGLLAVLEAKLGAEFREREQRDPTFDELKKLQKEAFSAARDEASPGFKPWDGPKARAGGLAKWDAWMDGRDAKWRDKIPPRARVTSDESEYVFGFELRSCQRGDFFFRIDKEDNLVLGYFNLDRAKLTPDERAKFEAALKEVRALDPGAAYGKGGCDFEQYYVRDDKRFVKTWIGVAGRPPELDDFIKVCRELIKAKFGESEALEFKDRTASFRGPD